MSSLTMVSEDMHVRCHDLLTNLINHSLQQHNKIPDPHGTQDHKKYSMLEILGVGWDEYATILVSDSLQFRVSSLA